MKGPRRIEEESPGSASNDQFGEAAYQRLSEISEILRISRAVILKQAQSLLIVHLEKSEISDQLSREKEEWAKCLADAELKNSRNMKMAKPDLVWLEKFTKIDEDNMRKNVRAGGKAFRLMSPFLVQACLALDSREDVQKPSETSVASFLIHGGRNPFVEAGVRQKRTSKLFSRTVPGEVARNDFNGFYNAEPQGLNAIAANCDVTRSVYAGANGLQERLFSGDAQACDVVVLTGSSGAGKSILLDRASHDALAMGWNVFRCHGFTIAGAHALFEGLNELVTAVDGNCLVVIDGSEDAVRRGVSPLALSKFEPSKAGVSIKILMAMNHNLLSADQRSTLPASSQSFATFRIAELDDDELQSLVDGIIKAEESGKIQLRRTAATKEERLAQLASRKDRIALIALLVMRYGQGVREILREEYAPLTSQTKQILRRCALLEKLGVAMPAGQFVLAAGATESSAELQHLTRLEGGRRMIRHPRLVSPTLDVALPQPFDRCEELIAILIELGRSGNSGAAALRDIFTLPRVARRIASLFKHDEPSVIEFVSRMELLSEEFLCGNCGALMLAFLGQISKDALCQYDKAAVFFKQAAKTDTESAFFRRQLAWSYHKLGDNVALLDTIRGALKDFPDAEQLRCECASMLAMTATKENISLAQEIILQLAQNNPDDGEIERVRERIGQFKTVVDTLPNDELPEWAAEKLSLDRLVWRARKNTNRYYNQLLKDLRGSLAGAVSELDVIKEIEELDVPKDRTNLKAVIKAHLARHFYQRWYDNDEDVDLDEVEKMFRDAIKLWPAEPFAHCWLGTFLKEVRRDYEAAKREYVTARDLASKSRVPHFEKHPLIFNNLALLQMDMVREKLLHPKAGLEAAAKNLKTAIDGLRNHPQFKWPLQTKIDLEQLCAIKGVSFPRELFAGTGA